MKNSFTVIIFLSCALFFNTTYGQTEICNNGIDDDGDGFIDCYDKDCASSSYCEDFYFGRDSHCEVTPTKDPSFTIRELWRSANRTSSTLNRPSVGDLDGDGIPEVVSVNRVDRTVFILNGRDGTTIRSKNVGYELEPDVAIAKIEPNEDAYIFLYGRSAGELEVLRSSDLSRVWRRNVRQHGGQNQLTGAIGLADFNGDGKVELYYKDEIRNAHNGEVIINGSNVNFNMDIVYSPVAIDILDDNECSDCSGLELVAGNIIYSVNIEAGTMTPRKNLNNIITENSKRYFTKFYGPWNENWSSVSVADVNLDGHLDVVLTGAQGNRGGPTAIFFWDVKNEKVLTYNPPNNSQTGAGRVNIADVNGDGKMNLSFVSGNNLFSLHIVGDQLVPLWQTVIDEWTSGFTGCSVFDFDGDGAAEIIYRSEMYLLIIDGKDGSTRDMIACRSRTTTEYPVIADVTGDGSTNICVSCGTDDDRLQGGSPAPNFNANVPLGQVRVYGAANNEVWMPARKVWNQHGYFNVNVNDDLTIPRQQQKHHVVFSESSCDNSGVSKSQRPLNTFLNQAPFLNFDGCPTFPAPDISLVDGSIEISDPPVCPQRNFTVSFDISNDGDVVFYGNISVTFYNGNPFSAGSVRLNTVTHNVSHLDPGEKATIAMNVEGPGSAFNLFISVNDIGQQDPVIEYPVGDITECEYENNIGSISVNPSPFAIQIVKLRDDFLCDENLDFNGAARVVAIINGNEEVNDYTFSWYRNSVSDHNLIFVGPEASSLEEGLYYVRAVHSTYNCSSVTESVTIDRKTEIINDDVQIISRPQTDCSSPDGELIATVNGNTTNYTFDWYLGNDFTEVVASGSHIQNLEAFTYGVIITDLLSGCTYLTTEVVERDYAEPAPPMLVDKTDIVTCGNDQTGAIEVELAAGVSIEDFEFYWFDGVEAKLVPDYDERGPRLENLPIGTYTVVAVNKLTQCKSAAMSAVEIITDRIDPSFDLVKKDDHTTCSPFEPNGVAEVLLPDDASFYEIRWFEGRNTLEDYELKDHEGDLEVSALKGNTWYTVRVLDKRTNCFSTREIEILDLAVNPDVEDLTVTTLSENTNCTYYNGKLRASMPSNNEDYKFLWYRGNSEKSVPDHEGEEFDELEPGEYTVVVHSLVTGCKSEPRTVTIYDESEDPQFTFVRTHNYGCDPDEGLGEITITVTSAGNIEYEWYESGYPVSGGIIGTANRLTNLKAGTYTVIVRNPDTGCSESHTFSIEDIPAVPSLSLYSTSQTNCDQPDGIVAINSITVGGNPVNLADFQIRLYNEGNVLLDNVYSNGFSGLEQGTYYVEVYNPATGCSSILTSEVVQDERGFPSVILEELQHQTSCGPTPSGKISISALTGSTASTGGYEFFWYAEALPLSGNQPSFSNAHEVNELAAGDYSVVVKDLLTRCETERSFRINEYKHTPLAETASTAQTKCFPPDGEARVLRILENNVEQNLTNYDFKLYDANQDLIEDAIAHPFTGLESGEYWILAENKITGCSSVFTKVTVGENFTPLTVEKDMTVSRNNTSCNDNGNGVLQVIARTGGVISSVGYEFKWFTGGLPINENNVMEGETSNILSNLMDGTYSVEVTDIETGCSITASYQVQRDEAIPELVLSPVHQDWCTPNGQISVTEIRVHGNSILPGDVEFGNYSFKLYSNSGVLLDDENYPFTNLSAGTYFVEAIDNILQCESVKTPVTIHLTRVLPNIQLVNRVNQSSCDNLQPNGELHIDVASGSGFDPENFVYEWYRGIVPVSQANLLEDETGTSITNMSSGFYTLRVTNTLTGCSNEATFQIEEDIIEPVATITATPNTICYNGELTASVTRNGNPENVEDYEFFWYEGEEEDNQYLIQSGSNHVLSGFKEGKYTVVVKSKIFHCYSDPVTDEILDHTNPFSVILLDTQWPSDCDDEGGIITANPSPGGSYSYKWYRGGIPSDRIFNPDDELPGETGNVVDGLRYGLYTLELTNEDACKVYQSINIPYVGQPTLNILNVSDNTYCEGGNGSIEVELTLTTGSMGDFELKLYRGVSENGTLLETVPLHAGSDGKHTFSNLTTGDYTIVAVEKLSDCGSVPVVQNIRNESKRPVINLLSSSHVYCVEGRGHLEVAGANATGDATPNSTFTYFWTSNNGHALGSDATNPRIENLPPGEYTVTVTNEVTGCERVESFRIRDIIHLIEVSADVTHLDNCSPGLGRIDIAGISEHGNPGLLSDYNFFYIDEYNEYAIAGTFVEDLPKGIYYIKAINNAPGSVYFGCSSILKKVEIEDETTGTVAYVAAGGIISDRSCDADVNVGTGSITLELSQGDPADYSFTWYRGQNVATGVFLSQFSGLVATGLSAGYYTIEVTYNVNNACSGTVYAHVPYQNFSIELGNSAANLSISNSGNCSPFENGEITVLNVIENGMTEPVDLNHHLFSWYYGNGTPLDPLQHGSPVANSASIGGLAAGDYWVEVTNTNYSCTSVKLNVKVGNDAEAPVLIFNPNGDDLKDKSCDDHADVSVKGSVSVVVQNGGTGFVPSDYTFTWAKKDLNDIYQAIPETSNILTGMDAGEYRVEVRKLNDPDRNCFSTGYYVLDNIGHDISINPSLDTFATVTDQDDCSPTNGAVHLHQVMVDGTIIPLPHTDYDTRWFAVSGSSYMEIKPFSQDHFVDGLAAGNYSVEIRNNKSNCYSGRYNFRVQRVTQNPQIIFNALHPYEKVKACDPGAEPEAYGQLSAAVIEQGGTVVNGYTFTWYRGTGVNPDNLITTNISGVNSEIIHTLSQGYYTVEVSKNDSPHRNCLATSTFYMEKEISEINIVDNMGNTGVLVQHQTTCIPNGSVEVQHVSVNGQSQPVSDFEFEWYDHAMVPYVVGGIPATNPVLTDLAAGEYYVIARSRSTLCMSDPLKVTINYQPTFPVASFQEMDNTNCDFGNPNGSITVSAAMPNGDEPALGYEFTWYRGETIHGENLGGGTVLSSNQNILANVSTGYYTVEIRNASTGCINRYTRFVGNNPIPGSISVVSKSNMTTCNFPDGSIEVSVAPGNIADYTISWYSGAYFPGMEADHTGTTYTHLSAGVYYVVAENFGTCISIPVEIQIRDEAARPTITLNGAVENVTSCNLNSPNGSISVFVSMQGAGEPLSGYAFEWVDENNTSLQVTTDPHVSTMNGLPEGTYKVIARNLDSGCESERAFLIRDRKLDGFEVNASALPNTRCTSPNGQVTAYVRNLNSSFDFNWFIGSNTNSAPAFTGSTVRNLPAGTYTVSVYDRVSECTSRPVTVMIENNQITPEITLFKFPVTNCNPGSPNGALSASVNGETVGYRFEWFRGNDNALTDPLFQGSYFPNLSAGTYKVRVTNIISGCTAIETVVLEHNPQILDAPVASVLNNLTSCSSPDGSVTASMGGNTQDYFFHWFIGRNVKNQPDYYGHTIHDLDKGKYTVIAVHKTTGCQSPPVTVEIIEDQVFPEFEVFTVKSDCNMANGSAILSFSKNVSKVFWEVENVLYQNISISGVNGGFYKVTAVSNKGCSTTKDIFIGSNIIVYNGVSPNGDNINDKLLIDCVEQFANNHIRIYNRAGTLVYEASGYDNEEIAFIGEGNRGLYAGSNQVPDGTYFYIIDLKDGNKPLSGFLELIR